MQMTVNHAGEIPESVPEVFDAARPGSKLGPPLALSANLDPIWVYLVITFRTGLWFFTLT